MMSISCPLCLSHQIQEHYEKHTKNMGRRIYWKCSVCFLIFIDESCYLDFSEQKQRYDYHKNSPDDKGYVAFLNRLLIPFLQHLKQGMTGLDFGCGPGPTISTLLYEKSYEVNDYDPIYFPDDKCLQQQYDFVTCTEVIEHLSNPRDTFILMKKLLNSKDSFLGIMTQTHDDDTDFASWWYHKDDTHISFYHEKTLEWIAEWLGFDLHVVNRNVFILCIKD